MAAQMPDRMRHLPLAAALATALGVGLAPSSALATNWPVGRCSDMVGKGGDTLRVAVTKAGSGDTVDLTTLPSTCTGFTLTGGAITVGKTDLSIVSDRNITIDGGSSDRVFNHIGFGTLYLRYLTLTHGNAPSGDGGCVASYANVTLSHTTITACQASGAGGGVKAVGCNIVYSAVDGNLAPDAAGLRCTGSAQFSHSSVSGNLVGGGVSAASVQAYYSTFVDNTRDTGGGGGIASGGDVTLGHSVVSGNSANSGSNGDGGGVRAAGDLFVLDSFVLGNTAARFGGGLSSNNLASLTDSTVSGNHASDGGGLRAFAAELLRTTVDSNTASSAAGGVDSTHASITNSTISGNEGWSLGGLYGSTIIASNSTVAFNRANWTNAGSAGGLRGKDITMTSTIVAKNFTAAATAADIYLAADPSAFQPTNSLITSCNCSTLAVASDPRLAPLAIHGGAQATHALSAGSPAIDAGSAGGQPTDERGSGYPRVVGAAADIGAYERQANDDELFYSGFD